MSFGTTYTTFGSAYMTFGTDYMAFGPDYNTFYSAHMIFGAPDMCHTNTQLKSSDVRQYEPYEHALFMVSGTTLREHKNVVQRHHVRVC